MGILGLLLLIKLDIIDFTTCLAINATEDRTVDVLVRRIIWVFSLCLILRIVAELFGVSGHVLDVVALQRLLPSFNLHLRLTAVGVEHADKSLARSILQVVFLRAQFTRFLDRTIHTHGCDRCFRHDKLPSHVGLHVALAIHLVVAVMLDA